MRASTNPVLSSIKPADKTTTDSPEQPAEEAKVSSVAETVPATESKLTDYQSILKQIKQRKKSEFRVRNPEIELTGKLTPEELFQLNQKIISVSENWQEKFTFEEFKADKDKLQNHPQHRPLTADEIIENFKAYQDKWQNPQRRHYPPTVHELTDTFNKLKLAGLQWNFIINFSTEDTETINFITEQLKSGRVKSLALIQIFSEKQMDIILDACKTTKYISFCNQQQRITDKQANILLDYFSYNLKHLRHLPGKEISDETAGKLALVAVRDEVSIFVSVDECLFFDKRKAIESDIQCFRDVLWDHSFHTYSSEDIKNLGRALKKKYGQSADHENKSSPPGLTLCLESKIMPSEDPEWIIFFTSLLDSSVNITRLHIHASAIQHNILIAIITALDANRTIESLSFTGNEKGKEDEKREIVQELAISLKLNSTITHIEFNFPGLRAPSNEIIEALSNHPALTSLIMKNVFFANHWLPLAEEQFNNLLTNTKKLHRFELTNCAYDEDTIYGLASGLKENNTLAVLTLSALSNAMMGQLGRAFSCNQSLTEFTFDNSYEVRELPLSTPKGLYKFIAMLQASHLTNVSVKMREEKKETYAEHKELLHRITQENKEKWIWKKRQPYINAAIVLLQAAHAKHFLFCIPDCLNAILSFLRPSWYIATPKQIDRCNTVLRENIQAQTRKWKTTIDVEEYEEEEKKKITVTYNIFEKWNEKRKDDEQPENSSNPSPPKTNNVPASSPDDKKLAPPSRDWHENTITSTEFDQILSRYRSKSPLSGCCFFNSYRSTAMKELWKISHNSQITRAQIEQAIGLDSEQRKDFFNDKPDAKQGTRGTDIVIETLKRRLNY